MFGFARKEKPRNPQKRNESFAGRPRRPHAVTRGDEPAASGRTFAPRNAGTVACVGAVRRCRIAPARGASC